MSQILYDLVNGEFQQMTSRSVFNIILYSTTNIWINIIKLNCRTDKDDRFQLYLDKTFNKTASLMANSCKSVAILANEGTGVTDTNLVVSTGGEVVLHIIHTMHCVQDMAYKYGQNIGIAFQLVDDWLDFVSSADMLGEL